MRASTIPIASGGRVTGDSEGVGNPQFLQGVEWVGALLRAIRF